MDRKYRRSLRDLQVFLGRGAEMDSTRGNEQALLDERQDCQGEKGHRGMEKDTLTQSEKEKMFLELNSTLVKFWIQKGRPSKEVKIELLERMLNWYKKMGYITMD